MRPALVLIASTLAFAGLAASSASTAARAPVRAEIIHPPIEASWSELATSPCSFHTQTVQFAFQFDGRPARWHAGPTRFGPGAFAAISGWADEQFPWVPEEFEHPAVRVFVRLGSEPDRTLQGAHPHQRFAVTGIVRDVWRDRPWIELTSATPLDEAIGEATVFHAGRALERMEDGSFAIADEALQQALAAPLPAAARAELERLRTICAERMATPEPPPIRPRR